MASNPAEIMAAGQALVPNTVTQDLQHQMGRLQLQGAQLQNQAVAQQLHMQQIALQRQQSFGGDMHTFLSNPTAEGLAGLYGRYPEFAAQLKDSWGALDDQRRRSDTTQIGSAASLAAKGDYTGAANLIQSRIAADKAAGHDASTDQALYDHLTSSDPAQQKAALGMMTIALSAAVGPDHAADVLKANGMDRAPVPVGLDQRLVDPTTGQEIAGAHPKLELATNTYPDGSTRSQFGNPYTGKFGAAAVDGAAPAPADAASPSPSASAGAPTGSRADRNNNPGNLRAINPGTGKPVSWVTSLPGYQGADAQGYAIFAPGTATGTSAQQALLGRYFKAGRNTVSSIVEHWAPRQSAGGDNTDAQVNNYTAFVAKQLGVDPNKPLPASAIPQLAAAMHQFEAGATGHAGAVRVPPAGQAAPDAQPAAGAPPAATGAASDPYMSGAPVNSGIAVTKDAPAGYQWTPDHKGVVPIPGSSEDPNAYPEQMRRDDADNWIVTGQLPGGMGGAGMKRAFLATASQRLKELGYTSADLPQIRARYASDTQALKDSTAMIGALQGNEGTLRANLAQVATAHQRLVDLGVLGESQDMNRVRIWRVEHFGSKEERAALTSYRNAISTASGEYAKYMGSSSGNSGQAATDAANAKAASTMEEDYGPSAMRGVHNKDDPKKSVPGAIGQLLNDIQNRKTSVEAQNQALQQKLTKYLQPRQGSAPAQVRSIQQYNALPKGAPYIDPNGVHRVKR